MFANFYIMNKVLVVYTSFSEVMVQEIAVLFYPLKTRSRSLVILRNCLRYIGVFAETL